MLYTCLNRYGLVSLFLFSVSSWTISDMFYYNFATVISFVLLEIHVEILNLRIVPHVKLSRGRFTFFFFTQIKNIPRMRISAFQLIHSAKLIIFIKKIPTLLTLLIHFIILKINQRKKRKKIRNKKNKNK